MGEARSADCDLSADAWPLSLETLAPEIARCAMGGASVGLIVRTYGDGSVSLVTFWI
jgi:hypothetical protein